MVARPLSFVNISHPEEGRSHRFKASVRRHVMADVGRARRKKPKYRIIPLQVAAPETTPEPEPEKITEVQPPPVARMPPGFQTFRVDSDTRACELINFMTAEADYVYRPFRTSWIQIGLSDTAAFDLWLAQAVVIRNDAVQQDVAPWSGTEYLNHSEASKYYYKSLNQLSHRLNSRQDCVSSGVIATIMGFICVDTRVGNWDRYLVHMNGLERIYHLRNGFEGLEADLPLMAFWVDLMGASMLDRYPRFPVLKELNNAFQLPDKDDVPPMLRALVQRAERTAPQGKRIYAMLRKMAPVVAMVNRNSSDPLFWTQDAALVETLGLVSHFVLSVPKAPQDDVQTEYSVFVVQRMVQLACLMVISELKRLASFHWADMDPLRARFINMLQEPHYGIPIELERLRLWAIITVCSLSASGARDHLLVEAWQSMRRLGYHTAQQAIDHVKLILWLDSIVPIREEDLFLPYSV